ncbi:hypothetical protein ECE17_15525, partial [Acinetobacter baumannii]|nr:hypothetical protein [Acinetobacter baumannii]
ARRDAHKKERLFRVRWLSDLSKSTGNVGQQAKDSIRFSCRQANVIQILVVTLLSPKKKTNINWKIKINSDIGMRKTKLKNK